jgi:hypothetical protein
MSNSVAHLPNDRSLAIFSGVTRAIEYGFMAAGVTVAAIAAIQSVAIVVGWIAAA